MYIITRSTKKHKKNKTGGARLLFCSFYIIDFTHIVRFDAYRFKLSTVSNYPPYKRQ